MSVTKGNKAYALQILRKSFEKQIELHMVGEFYH